LVRHPLYSAVILLSLGWALMWGSAIALIGCLVEAFFFDSKARREERWLAEKFPEYAGYCRRVRRLIPWVY
jgi:protein-S-isoprenylcysteine O-methyltransferase Ste14